MQGGGREQCFFSLPRLGCISGRFEHGMRVEEIRIGRSGEREINVEEREITISERKRHL